MKKSLLLGLLAFVLILGACAEKAQPASDATTHDMAHGDHKQLPNGDLQEVTASADVLPTFLDDKSEQMRTIYQATGHATDILKWMPCYCGCGESAGHESNLNCFIDEVREDGSVVWDDHGTRCDVCLEIAVTSINMTQEGKSLKEIRDYIDKNYDKGYAEPTDTPMPA